MRAGATDPFTQRRRDRSRDRLRVALAVVGVLTMLAGLGWVGSRSGLLDVRQVEVVGGGRHTTVGQVLVAAGELEGRAMFEVDSGEVRRRVGALAGLRRVEVSRRWPGTVRIRVYERVPVASVHRGGLWRLVDATGATFAPSLVRPRGFVPVSSTGPRAVQALAAAARVVASLPALLRGHVTGVSAVRPDDVRLRLRGNAQVLWGGPADSPHKGAVLLALLRTGARQYDVSTPSVVTTR